MGSPMSSSSSENFARLAEKPFYFDPDVESPQQPDGNLSKRELSQMLMKMDDISHKINEVRNYHVPMSKCQISKLSAHVHAFNVFKTDNWWWSIEPDCDRGGFVIQRSKQLENVRDKFRREDRISSTATSGIELKKQDPARKNLTIIQFFIAQFDLDDVLESQRFANGLYDVLVKSFK